jgi:hypothetical protein
VDAGEQQLQLRAADPSDRRFAIGGAVRDVYGQAVDRDRFRTAIDLAQVPPGVVAAEHEVRKQDLVALVLAGDRE